MKCTLILLGLLLSGCAGYDYQAVNQSLMQAAYGVSIMQPARPIMTTCNSMGVFTTCATR